MVGGGGRTGSMGWKSGTWGLLILPPYPCVAVAKSFVPLSPYFFIDKMDGLQVVRKIAFASADSDRHHFAEVFDPPANVCLNKHDFRFLAWWPGEGQECLQLCAAEASSDLRHDGIYCDEAGSGELGRVRFAVWIRVTFVIQSTFFMLKLRAGWCLSCGMTSVLLLLWLLLLF